MANKQQAIRALKKHCENALLIDEKPPSGHMVQLEAPKGQHWEGSVHCQPVVFWHCGPKNEYWDLVIEEILELPKAVLCNDNDCEGIKAWGDCDYWI